MEGVFISTDEKLISTAKNLILLEGYCWPINRAAFSVFMDEVTRKFNITPDFEYGEYRGDNFEIMGGRQK